MKMVESGADQARLINKSDPGNSHLSSNCQSVKRVNRFQLVLCLGLTSFACLAILLAVHTGPWRSTFTATGTSTTDVVGLAAAPVQTCGGNHFEDDHGEGSVCIFPFQYKGRTYRQCTKDGRGMPWCATSVSRGRSRRRSRSKMARSWGYCVCDQFPSHLMTCKGRPGIAQTQSMTIADYDDVALRVVTDLKNLSTKCTAEECPRADYAGCVLRVAGHDFMDFHNGKGGSDGCTDMTDPDNAGLAECMQTGETHGSVSVKLHSAYDSFCTKISLADFFVIAAEAVMTELRPGHADVNFKSNFRYGRRTATDTCKFEFVHGILPNPEGSCDEVERVFVKNMGLTKAEATALSGVHTLGRARQEHSGYEGWWSDPHNSRIFNNNYFVSLVAKGWGPKKAINGNPNKNMWIRSDVDADEHDHEMMLNTDMCLAYFEDGEGLKADKHPCCAWFNPEFFSDDRKRNVGLPPQVTDANGKELCGHEIIAPGVPSREVCCETFGADKGKAEIDCGSPVIPNGLAGEDIILFAKDEKAWLQVFQTAWKKATENGAQGLRKLESSGGRRRGGRRRRDGRGPPGGGGDGGRGPPNRGGGKGRGRR